MARANFDGCEVDMYRLFSLFVILSLVLISRPLHAESKQTRVGGFEFYPINFLDQNNALAVGIVIFLMSIVLLLTFKSQAKKNAKLVKYSAELSAIYNSTPVIMFVGDADRRILKVNRATLDFTGLSEEEALGLRSGELFNCAYAADDKQGCGFGGKCQTCLIRSQVLETNVKGKKHLRQEASLTINMAGEIKHLQLLVSSTPMNMGSETQTLVCIEDVTDFKEEQIARQANEQQRKDTETKYLNLFNMSRDGFVINRGFGELLDVNPAFANILGYEINEINNMFWRDITPKHWLKWELKKYKTQFLERGFTDLYEKEYIRKDGTVVPVETQAFLLNEPERIEDAQIATFARDISAFKKAEAEQARENTRHFQEIKQYQEHLEALVEVRTAELQSSKNILKLALQGAGAGIYYWDVAKDELKWNPRSLEIFGQQEIQNYAGWERCVHPEDLPAMKAQLNRDLPTEQILNLHYRIIRPSEEVRYIWASAMIIRNAAGELQALSGLHFDETEKKHSEQELKRAQKVAEEASRAKSTFISNVSHELRTPLTAILGYSQLISRTEGLTGPLREKINIINRSGQYLHEMINDVLTISRIESGSYELNPEQFCLQFLFDDLKAMLQLHAAKKGLGFEFTRNATSRTLLFADKKKLRQILINLLWNAIKLTDAGTISVTAKSHQHNATQAELTITVDDSGPGISEEDQEKIFQPFEQGVAGKRSGGTGLGLAISKKLIILMGGDLRVENNPEGGGRFTLTFPAELPQQVGELTAQITSQRIANVTDLAGKCFLLVDDEQATRMLLHQLFQPYGVKILEAENGKEAIALAQFEKPDLIFMDMRMPVMDGYETIRLLKSSDRFKALILAMSASTFDDDKA
ncbi:MAG: PAS domain S-box protein, partial [Geopsychrobacter sp.]|nr:PAS domain S-box protein [Geopsychrobacter sp.]